MQAILLGRIGFYCGGLHGVARVNGVVQWEPVSEDATTKKLLVVVGRQHYFETVRDYPVGQRNDVRRVIKNEPWRFPHSGHRFDRIERLSPQAHRVTSWVIKSEVLDTIGNGPLWIIPETVCFETLAYGKAVAIERLGETLFLAATAEGLISSRGGQKAFEDRVFTSKGNADQEGNIAGIMRLPESDSVQAILKCIRRVLKATPIKFFRGFELVALQRRSWTMIAKLSAASCIAYVLITSLYLSIATQWVDYQLLTNKFAAETPMSNRRDIAIHRGWFDELKAVLSDQYPHWVAWDVFLDLVDDGVQFRAVNSSANAVTFYLTADRATDVLDRLSRDPRVRSAKFSRPVRKVGGSEQFAIEATFRVATQTMSKKTALDAENPTPSAGVDGVDGV